MKSLRFKSPGEDCTLLIGRRIGELLEPGDILSLRGELGAGKTLLVRGIARGLGVPESVRVTSPTFTIINEYAGRLLLFHLDLYRISGPDELETLPWEETLFGRGIAAIEWPERLGRLLPSSRIDVKIYITGEECRSISILGRGKRYAERVAQWADKIADLINEPSCGGIEG